MLDFVNLEEKLPREVYKQQLPAKQLRLLQLQRTLREACLGTLVVFEGWDAAGKGRVIRKLTEPLEPRGFELEWVREPRSRHEPMPWMWRFWRSIPAHGAMTIYDHSWYWRALVEKQEAAESRKRRHPWLDALRDIALFERLLVDERYLVVKFFLHIDRAEQRRRMAKLEKDPEWSWMVQQMEPDRHSRYEEDAVLIEEMLERTEIPEAPWRIVAATDHRHAKMTVFDTLIEAFESALAKHGFEVPPRLVDQYLDSCNGEGDIDDNSESDNGEGDNGEDSGPSLAESRSDG